MKYITIEQSFKMNGDRHLQNAINYHSCGMIKHCIGSIKKTIKNYEKYEYFQDTYNLMIKEMQNRIAEKILNG